ncbi:hypothetical protein HDK77DRAFT_97221 [Phyllosticta capitalensis]
MRFTTAAAWMGCLALTGLLSTIAAAPVVPSASENEGSSTAKSFGPSLSYNPHDSPREMDSVAILPRGLPEVPSGHPGLDTYSLSCWDLKNHRNRGTLDLRTGTVIPSNESDKDRKKREKELEKECKARKDREKEKQKEMKNEIKRLEKEDEKKRDEWLVAERKEMNKFRWAVNDKEVELATCKKWSKKDCKDKALSKEERKECKAAAKLSQEDIKEEIKAIKKQEDERSERSGEQESQRRMQASSEIQDKKEELRRYKESLKKIEKDRAHKYDHTAFKRANKPANSQRGKLEVKKGSWLDEKIYNVDEKEWKRLTKDHRKELAENDRDLKRDDEILEGLYWAKPENDSGDSYPMDGKILTYTWLGNTYCDKYSGTDPSGEGKTLCQRRCEAAVDHRLKCKQSRCLARQGLEFPGECLCGCLRGVSKKSNLEKFVEFLQFFDLGAN